jgi:hypothetical protein
VAGLDQIARHAGAHLPESDERYFHDCHSPYLSLAVASLSFNIKAELAKSQKPEAHLQNVTGTGPAGPTYV